jgi:hypothetical protein
MRLPGIHSESVEVSMTAVTMNAAGLWGHHRTLPILEFCSLICSPEFKICIHGGFCGLFAFRS